MARITAKKRAVFLFLIIVAVSAICYILLDIGRVSFPETYTDPEYHFSLQYPANLAETSFSVPSGSSTGEVVLLQENISSSSVSLIPGMGMQISILPFNKGELDGLTADVVKQSVPNLTMIDSQNITVGGLGRGISFLDGIASSSNRQIWFIEGGHLYQVTAPESFSETALDVLSTWKFTQ